MVTPPRNYVIFDCDGGSDDAWGLMLLLKADQEKRVKLLGVTICGCGNTDSINAARNMLRILRASGRNDIPVFMGAEEPLIPEQKDIKYYLGVDGFGDILPKTDIPNVSELVERQHAVVAINQFCQEKPKEVTIVAVGPLTNIALCYSMYGRKFADSVKDLYIMGGNFLGVGNATRSAEFNFFCDPEAAHIVLSKAKCPITVLPWEPCVPDRFFIYNGAPSISLKWRLETFGEAQAPNSAALRLMNEVERATWIPLGSSDWHPCDAMLVAAFLFGPKVVRKSSEWNAVVALQDMYTRGQMVLDHKRHVDKNPLNVRIIELIDSEFMKLATQWATGSMQFLEHLSIEYETN